MRHHHETDEHLTRGTHSEQSHGFHLEGASLSEKQCWEKRRQLPSKGLDMTVAPEKGSHPIYKAGEQSSQLSCRIRGGLTWGLWMGAGIWPHEPLLIQPQAPRAILWPPAGGRLGKSAKPGDSAPPSPGLTVTNSLDAVSCHPAPAWHLRKLKPSWPGAHLGLAGLVILHVSHDGRPHPRCPGRDSVLF